MSKVLLREYKEHIEGYGLVSDLKNDTCFGMTKGEIGQYARVWTEFEEDPSLPKYEVGSKVCGLYDIPYKTIPRGTLSVYGELKESLVIDHDDDAMSIIEGVNVLLEDLGVKLVENDELNEKAWDKGSGQMFYDIQKIAPDWTDYDEREDQHWEEEE